MATENLTVQVNGDASGFNRTLANVKNSAGKLNNDLARQQQKVQSAASIRLASAGGKAAGLASAASGIPGMGQAGQAISGAAMAFFSLKEGAAQLGTSTLKAAGILGAVAFAATMLTKLFKEAYVNLQEALDKQLRTMQASGDQETRTRKAYLKTLEDNRKSMTESEYKRLKAGAQKNDSGAFAEIRSKFGGTVLNKELQKDLARAQIEAMPRGAARSLAEENMRFSDEKAKLREKVGDKPSQATAAIARQIYAQMTTEYNNKLADIQKEQLKELKEIKGNTKTGNPFQ